MNHALTTLWAEWRELNAALPLSEDKYEREAIRRNMNDVVRAIGLIGSAREIQPRVTVFNLDPRARSMEATNA